MTSFSKPHIIPPNHSSKSQCTKPRSTNTKQFTQIKYIPCSQINLHRSANPTAQFYYNIELNDDAPYITFVQEPYCYNGKPMYLPGNGKTFFYPSPDNKNPRATLTISRNIEDQFFFQTRFSDRDTATCSIELPHSKLYVSSIYMDGNEPFPIKFINLAEHCLKHKHGLIIGTDSNSHHTAWGNTNCNSRGHTLIQLLAQAGLLWSNNGKHTYKRHSQETAIDLTLRNDFAPLIEFWDTVPNFSLSDHILIEFVITLKSNVIKSRPIRSINKKQCNWDSYSTLVKNAFASRSKTHPNIKLITTTSNHNSIFKKSNHELNQLVDHVNNILHDSFIKSCPPTFIRTKKNLTWWSTEMNEAEIDLIKCRDDLESDPNDIILQTRYNEAHKALNSLILKESNKSWQAFCTGLQKQKNVAKICRSLSGKKSTSLTSLKKPDSSYTESPKETLELLANTLYTTTETNRTELNPCHEQMTYEQINTIITQSRLDEAIAHLKKNKTAGHDNISNEMLVNAYDTIKIPLLNIMKLSLFRTYIPKAWQTSNSAILSKPGKTSYFEPKSFRIITLSSCTLKLMERIILWHLQRDLKLEISLSPKQYGFRKGSSTEAAILKLVSKVESALKIGNFALGIFLDVQAAFDNIPFIAIKKALEKTKAKGNVSNWILHLITNRKLKLNLKGIAIIIWILAGCPQGGVLSPFLWNIVLDSLLITLRTLSHLIAFADDLAIILTGFCIMTLRDLGQQYLSMCNKWCEANGLKLNALKTQIIIFSRKNNIRLPKPIRLQGIEIEFCKTVKYLGITLDSKLNWQQHVQETAQKCTKILFATRKMIGDRWGITPDKIIWVYNSIIKPIMTYACVTWAPRILTQNTKLHSLNRPGNLSLLMASGAKNSSSQEALHHLFSVLPASLELEKAALLQALRLKSLEHWPKIVVDHSMRKSFEPCQIILDKILHSIFNNKNINNIDQTRPTDISSKIYHLHINPRDMTPLEPLNYLTITYTDGSKHTKDNSTGYGLIIFLDEELYITENYTLSDDHTVFQCEAHAIYRASKLLKDILTTPNYKNHRVIIYTDSQALIKSLQKSYTFSKTVLKVHNSLNSLAKSHPTSIEWIPGHEGHKGNEIADKLANCRKPNFDETLNTEKTNLPQPLPFFKRRIYDHIQKKFNERWQNCNISQNTKNFLSPILKHNLNGQHLFKLNTDILRPLTRLITGHNNLNHFQNKLDSSIAPNCSFCNEHHHETALHLVCNCVRFSQTRQSLFGKPTISIYEAIHNISNSKNLKLQSLLNFVGNKTL